MENLINQWNIRQNIVDGNEERSIQSFTSTSLHLDDGSWRIWYSKYDTGVSVGHYGFGYMDFSHDFKLQRDTFMRIVEKPAQSGLNIIGVPPHWNLIQPVYLKLSDGRERIYFWAHGSEGVCRYIVADSTDGVNFIVEDWHRPTLYHPNDRAVSRELLRSKSLAIYCHEAHRDLSPDEPAATGDMLMNDATNVYVMPDGTFELYSADVIELLKDLPEPHQKDPIIRIIQRRTSADGIHWSAPQQILIRDEKDPFDLQFYYLSVTYTQNARIGILGHYRSDPGTQDIEFCFSQDGIHWDRQRKPGFPRWKGVEGVYAPHDMVQAGDLYYLFYSGYSQTHHGVVSPDAPPDMPRSWIGLATIPVSAFLQ